jgi:hypothetical protein
VKLESRPAKLFAALYSAGTLAVFGVGVFVYDHDFSRIPLVLKICGIAAMAIGIAGVQAVERRQRRYEGVQLGPRSWTARERHDDEPS